MEIHLDNSAFSLLICDYLFQRRVVQGYSGFRNEAASFGDAVHKGLEYADKGLSDPEIMEKLHKEVPASNLPKVLTLLTYHKLSTKLPPAILLADNTPAVEVKFSHKYGSFIGPNGTLISIFLEGTIDRIYLDTANDILVIMDYKTTAAATPYMIEKTIKEYSLSFQLPFYFFALKNFGILPASYLEYITARRYRMEIRLLCHSSTPPTFKTYMRSAFNDDYVTREIPMIINTKISQALAIAQMTSQAAKTGFTVYNACSNCMLRNPCLHSGEAKEAEILSSYEIKPYDPLSFR